MEEVEAAFAMYRDEIAKTKFDGRTVKELNDEEIKALDESIPFKFERPEVEETTDEQAPAEETPAQETK